MDILCYEHTRVKLTRNHDTDYINACFVDVSINAPQMCLESVSRTWSQNYRFPRPTAPHCSALLAHGCPGKCEVDCKHLQKCWKGRSKVWEVLARLAVNVRDRPRRGNNSHFLVGRVNHAPPDPTHLRPQLHTLPKKRHDRKVATLYWMAGPWRSIAGGYDFVQCDARNEHTLAVELCSWREVYCTLFCGNRSHRHHNYADARNR